MSELTGLGGLVVERFTAAFGEPTKAGNARHWSLRSLQYIAPVNVLVHNASRGPVVWVFNPHEPTDGVSSTPVETESQIEPLIASITDTVKKAGRSPT